jgi:hypothetical protein
MTVTTYPAASAPPVRATSTTKALKAEWTKLRTLPSTWRTAAMATGIAIGMSAAVVASQASQWHCLTAEHRTLPPQIPWRGCRFCGRPLDALSE